jgi:hypothetical protein
MIFKCKSCQRPQYKPGTHRILLGKHQMVCHACAKVIDLAQDVSSAASILGHSGGKSKSRAKTIASRTNGKLGGRPKAVK